MYIKKKCYDFYIKLPWTSVHVFKLIFGKLILTDILHKCTIANEAV